MFRAKKFQRKIKHDGICNGTGTRRRNQEPVEAFYTSYMRIVLQRTINIKYNVQVYPYSVPDTIDGYIKTKISKLLSSLRK